MQGQQDALAHQPVRMPLPSRMPSPTLDPGQQWLDHRPQLDIDFPRLRASHATPPDQRSRGDPPIAKIISLGILSPYYERQPRNYLAFLGLAAAICCYERLLRLIT